MKEELLLLGLASILTTGHAASQQKKAESRVIKPNIVYILADDLGYGDLSCYGQNKFKTPNIDKLASEGMMFTEHYAGCTVCAPSRSSLMTGLTTGHTPVRGNKHAESHEGQWPLPDSSFTIAEMLKQAGYVTGAFGKWGLGYPGSTGDPVNQGFDEFYGYNSQTLAHNYYPGHLWHNRQKIILEGNNGNRYGEYSPELIQQQALKFIEDNQSKPFFLYYATTIPHAELLLPEKYLKKYRGNYDPERQYNGAEYGDQRFREGAYGTQPECHAAFAAMVTLLDKQLGEVYNKLKELGLEKNTLIIFTSDNGPHQEGGADPDYFNSNGPLRGYKRDLYEGGVREPMIAYWPGHIKAGSKSDHISAFWDVMPTFATLTGSTSPSYIDGISFLPTLLGEPGQKEHDYIYFEFHEQGGKQSVRKGKWKLIRLNVLNPEKTTLELYNLSTDIGEEHNIAPDHPEVVKELETLMDHSRTPSETFPFQTETFAE